MTSPMWYWRTFRPLLTNFAGMARNSSPSASLSSRFYRRMAAAIWPQVDLVSYNAANVGPPGCLNLEGRGDIMRTIYHIVDRAEWEAARAAGLYRPDSLLTDGFIHAGYAGQVGDVADNLFRGERGLVLLYIDPQRVQAEVREDEVDFPPGHLSLHPHIYGPLNTDAVIGVVDFPPDDDGTFTVPADLT
jgi:uncharacterized protein (DUF952 family)